MNRKLFLSFFLIILCAQINFSQTAAAVGKDGVTPEMRKDVVALLRETSTEVNSLRTLENRISFTAELAALMWFEDEKEARTMLQGAVTDFRQLLANYDAQINAAGISPDEEQIYLPGENDSAQFFRKFMKAVAVRQQIATAIAEHDPKLALEFFYDTALIITHPKFRKQIADQDSYFETRLLRQITEKDVDTALKYACRTLEKGFNYETVGLLKTIYEKDADKGISFGEDVAAKLKSEVPSPENIYFFSSLLNAGAESLDSIKGQTGKKPMLSEQSLREIADLFAQQILKREDGDESSFTSFLPLIERFAPSRAAQIRQKFKIKSPKTPVKSNAAEIAQSVSTDKSEDDPTEKLFDSNANQLSKEEREKLIAQARKRISEAKDPNQKLLGLTELAQQLARIGDKEAAAKIMEESRNLLSSPPKNYQDFMQVWLIASGYAQIDADKAFPILEDAIFRLNDTISAFVKVGEFIDVNGEMIEDGEIQVGSFGGEMSRDLMKNLGTTDTTIRSLAVADFARTRALTNKFDRPEARILAKMLVLRGILVKSKVQSPMSNVSSP